jgi:DNA-binding transcriptional MerR regulator
MRTVKEVSKLTGVSVRALHHYDTIGLLKPTKVTQAGYRLYDDETVEKLYLIMKHIIIMRQQKKVKLVLEWFG